MNMKLHYWAAPDMRLQSKYIAMNKKNIDVSLLVIKATCEFYGISTFQLFMRCNKPEYAIPRHICMYVLFKDAGIKKGRIAEIFQRDHSTALNSIQVCSDLMDTDAIIKEHVQKIMEKWKSYMPGTH